MMDGRWKHILSGSSQGLVLEACSHDLDASVGITPPWGREALRTWAKHWRTMRSCVHAWRRLWILKSRITSYSDKERAWLLPSRLFQYCGACYLMFAPCDQQISLLP